MRRITGAVAAVLLATMLAACGTSGGDSGSKTTTTKASSNDDKATETTVDEGDDSSEPDDTTDTTEAEGEDDGGSDAGDPGMTKDNPLPLGTAADVGDFSVKVTEVNLNADADVEAFNDFNDPPEKGRYITLVYSSTYNGSSEGDPSFELSLKLSGGDARQYATFDCGAVVSDYEDTTLEPGGSTDIKVCFDVPVDAIDGAAVFIEDFSDFDAATRRYWALS